MPEGELLLVNGLSRKYAATHWKSGGYHKEHYCTYLDPCQMQSISRCQATLQQLLSQIGPIAQLPPGWQQPVPAEFKHIKLEGKKSEIHIAFALC